MQPDFRELELSALYDLLATYTEKFTLMMRAGSPTGEFNKCEEFIIKLQTEIGTRQGQANQAPGEDLGVIATIRSDKVYGRLFF